MTDNIIKEKELLKKLNIELMELKRVLIGEDTLREEVTATCKEDCLMDTLRLNLGQVEYALDTVVQIKNTIMGGN